MGVTLRVPPPDELEPKCAVDPKIGGIATAAPRIQTAS
jgi:hypothetical protein